MGTVLYADLQILIGSIVGVRFALKNRKEEQPPLKYGIIVGLGGGVLSAVLIGFFEWIILSINFEFNYFALIYITGIYLIAGIVIGLIMGALISMILSSKELRRLEEEEHIDEDFFKDLIKD
ncbi:MAG: hypothetical protein ACFE9T_08740 [Promethearchaeota archaeon]